MVIQWKEAASLDWKPKNVRKRDGKQHPERCTFGRLEDESICSLCGFCFNPRKHILLTRILGSDMSSGIREIRGGHLLLETHLMGKEQAVDIITGDGIYQSSQGGNQWIKL